MKPRENKPSIVYRIINSKGNACGSYSRACHDEYDFRSPAEARDANCHGMFRSPKYTIAKYRVTYELLSDDAEKDEREGCGR